MERPKQPKVSVCIITYNHEKYIHQCLKSIVEQETNFSFEVIVGDDCSTDNTQDIIKSFSEKYSFISSILRKKNTGGSDNCRDVHDMAKGEYICHLDGDDLAFPGKLQAQANILDQNPTCMAVWHRVDFFDDHGNYYSGKTADLSPFKKNIVTFSDAIRLGYVSVHSSLMYRRSARNKEQEEKEKEILDLYRTWDVLSSGVGYILDDVLGGYRLNASGSITVNSQIKVQHLALQHANYFLQKYPEEKPYFFLFSISRAIISTKNLSPLAMDYFKFALKTFSFRSLLKIANNLFDMKRIQVSLKDDT